MKGSYSMKKNKIILSYCKNFYKIKNFEYDSEDYITNKLLSVYEEYIFTVDEKNSEELENLKKIDNIFGRYVDDYNYRKEIKRQVLNIRVKKGVNVINSIINSLINIDENYEEGYTRNIYFARWI